MRIILSLPPSKGEFRHVMGLALDGRRLDLLERCLRECPDQRFMLGECMRLALRHVSHRDFRQRVFGLLLTLHSALAPPDLFEICDLLVSLNEPVRIAEMLVQEIGHKACCTPRLRASCSTVSIFLSILDDSIALSLFLAAPLYRTSPSCCNSPSTYTRPRPNFLYVSYRSASALRPLQWSALQCAHTVAINTHCSPVRTCASAS